MGEHLTGGPCRIAASQRPAVLKHLLGLSDDDRYGRFATSLSDAGIESYAGRIDFERDICLALAGGDGGIIGFLHLAVHGNAAELGASVSASWRKQGVARRLFGVAVRSARQAGIGEIHLATAHPVARHIFAGLGHPCQLQATYPRGVIRLG